MAWHYIEHKEISTAYFAVEADSPEEALRRFDEWCINSEQVVDTMYGTDNQTAETCIISQSELPYPYELSEYDMLSEQDYMNL